MIRLSVEELELEELLIERLEELLELLEELLELDELLSGSWFGVPHAANPMQMNKAVAV